MDLMIADANLMGAQEAIDSALRAAMKRLGIRVAREVAVKTGSRQVILLAWDGTLTHVVTYGVTAEDCAQAAEGGNMLAAKWGWPECNDQPSRVKKLEKEIAEIRAKMAEEQR
jgi:heterodisulfide reductase subunit C